MGKLVINAATREKRAAVIENEQVVDLMIEQPHQHRIVGAIYKGRVEKVLPGMQAAFVNIGREKNAFLYRDDLLSFYCSQESSEKKKDKSISHYVHQGEELIVQVTKEEIGTKGCRVTNVVTVPGHHLVYLPHSEYIAVSKKFKTSESREQWRLKAEQWVSHPEGLILRTAAEAQTESALVAELEELRKEWQQAVQNAKSKRVPALILPAPGFIDQTIKDYASSGLTEIVVDDVAGKKRIDQFLAFMQLSVKTTLYRDRQNIFSAFGIDRQLDLATRRQIWLKSGAFLVFDQTEAMTVVDVNTGKFTGKTKLEDTVLKVNLEAVDEICRQMRLRDLGGIILIDFIDLRNEAHKVTLTKALEATLRKDRTQTSVRGLTKLGLMEVTRKKVKESLQKSLQTECPVCRGTGYLLSMESLAFKIERELWEYRDQAEAVVIELPRQVQPILFGEGDEHKNRLEQTLGFELFTVHPNNSHSHSYAIQYVGEKAEAERLISTH